MDSQQTDALLRCESVKGSRWDPNGRYECANRARWRAVGSGQVFCGRHIRYVGRVVPIDLQR